MTHWVHCWKNTICSEAATAKKPFAALLSKDEKGIKRKLFFRTKTKYLDWKRENYFYKNKNCRNVHPSKSYILPKATFPSSSFLILKIVGVLHLCPTRSFQTQEAAWKGERIQQVVTGAACKHYSGLHGIARNCSRILGLRGEFWPPKRAKWIRWSKANPAKVGSPKSVGKKPWDFEPESHI